MQLVTICVAVDGWDENDLRHIADSAYGAVVAGLPVTTAEVTGTIFDGSRNQIRYLDAKGKYRKTPPTRRVSATAPSPD